MSRVHLEPGELAEVLACAGEPGTHGANWYPQGDRGVGVAQPSPHTECEHVLLIG